MNSTSQTVAQPRTLASPKAQIAPRIAGVAFASVFTGLIWVGMISLAGSLWGRAFTPAALAGFGCAIAIFVAAVCGPLMLRDEF